MYKSITRKDLIEIQNSILLQVVVELKIILPMSFDILPEQLYVVESIYTKGCQIREEIWSFLEGPFEKVI